MSFFASYPPVATGGGGTPGGFLNSVQINNGAGNFTGDSNLTYSGSVLEVGAFGPITTTFHQSVNMPELSLDGATSGTLSVFPAAITTSYFIVMPSAQGTGALTNDGLGNLSWSTTTSVAPVVHIYAAGTFIGYTPTVGTKYFIVELVGGGGDGAGGGLAGTGGTGATAGTSAFTNGGTTVLQCGTGSKGNANPPTGGAGGVSVATTLPAGAVLLANNPGSPGQSGVCGVGLGTTRVAGGNGGTSYFGGGGQGGYGSIGTQSTAPGSGGGGGALNTTAVNTTDASGGGGGSGSYIKALIYAAQFGAPYVVTAGSDNTPTGGAAGTAGFKGGGARGGKVVITEYF